MPRDFRLSAQNRPSRVMRHPTKATGTDAPTDVSAGTQESLGVVEIHDEPAYGDHDRLHAALCHSLKEFDAGGGQSVRGALAERRRRRV